MMWRRADREDRQVAGLWAVCAALALVLRPLWIAGAGSLPPCLWHVWTGWPCPGCGTTRAIVRLLHADPAGALALNPLAACGAMAFVLGGLGSPVWLAYGGKRPHVAVRTKPAWIASLAVALLANWAWLAFAGV
jgi:hypothetical protein